MDERELQFYRSWYLDDIRDALIPAIERGDADDPVGALYRRFARNAGDNDKGVLDDEAFVEFLGLVSEAAALLPDVALIRESAVPEYFKRFLLRTSGRSRAAQLTRGSSLPIVNIRSMMFMEGRLLIEGFFDAERPGEIERLLAGDGPEKEPPVAEIGMRAGGRTIPLPDVGHYAEIRYFGRTLASFRTFEAALDVARPGDGDEIYFTSGRSPAGEGTSHGEVRCRMVFAEPESGLSPGLGCLYRNFGPFAVEYDPASYVISICVPSAALRLKNERRALRCLMRSKIPLSRKFLELSLRAAWFITRPYFKRLRMRLYYDRIYMGDDNGQYLFEYSSDRCRAEGGPVGKHRYLVSGRSGAYTSLKRGGYKVHAFESPYSKLLALHADVILATHPNAKGFTGLNNFEKRWFADLFPAHVVCVQHGLAMRRAPQYQARYIDNTELYFCASEKEAENLRQEVYGYGPDRIRVTGLPRFDGLVSYPEDIVLLAPTWRRSSAVDGNLIGTVKPYNPEFRDTAYFDVYSRLLGDEALLSLIEESGYRLVFLLHPALSSQAPDFEAYAGGPVEVALSSRRGYEQYLNQAAVLITDYNDVQYDFAYMEKPIVYYHPDALPPTYESGAFDYETMGFGPVAKDPGELAGRLSALLGTGGDGPSDADESADMTGTYAARARAFFAYHDRENRSRIYEEIEKEYGE